jgi:uncharacterized protein YeaO (DUF488 family)
MKWQKERDLLIAQTMAFVQSIAGAKPELESRIQLMPPGKREKSDSAVDIQVPRMQSIAPTSDLRAEMQNHIASFRAHQERFHRERETYFLATLAKARAAIESQAAADKLQK